MFGYSHPAYAESLSEFGSPRALCRCGGWILVRQIPGFHYRDAMGCYPLFNCQQWSSLPEDLAEIEDELVTIALVTDPFGDYSFASLKHSFQIVKPFKEHYVVDLACSMDSFVSQNHRRYVRKANGQVTIEICDKPIDFLDEWLALYATLVERHNIQGISAFSISSFAKQLKVPGIVAIRAVYEQTTVGMLLWYVDGDVGYYHLGASSDKGYSLRVSYALFWLAIEHFQTQGLGWLDLGAGAGLKENVRDGLSRFKNGWSTGTRTAYFCGQIFDYDRYREIMQAKGMSEDAYFPAYRKGEFG